MATIRTRGTTTSFFADWARENGASTPIRLLRSRRRVAGLAVAGLLLSGAASVLLPTGSASADPSAHAWYRLRMCESSNNYRTNTGNDHYGAYQFDLATWHSVGGHGYPNRASAAEQDARALILYRERGWQPWQCASILGLHEDADAGTGRINDIHVPSGGSGGGPTGGGTGGSPGSSIPRFPGGDHWYTYGDNNRHIKTFQDQMHHRGYFPPGTGQYGPLTQAMVKRLQRLNGLIPNGYIGPDTWRLAWTGHYRMPAPPTGTGGTATKIPPFPGGDHWYNYGENNRHIKRFQNAMHRRGYFPPGTGQYGPLTQAMVKQLQRLNGLVPNGYIGPNTWKLAWVGKYRAP